MRAWPWIIVACFGFTVGLVPSGYAQTPRVDSEQLERARELLIESLYRLQDERTGGWFGPFDESIALDKPQHDAGLTVLATYALLAAGESPEVNESLARGLEFVERSQREWTDEVDGTYVIGIRNHIWPLLPRETYAAALERDTKRLLAGADRRGCFSYLLSQPPGGQPDSYYDHSTTQYGVLGLWEAAKAGARVPDAFWERVANHFIDTQWPDGGWSYSPSKESTESMTCAGLTVLTVAQQQLGRSNRNVNPKLNEAIQRGLAYLDERFDGPQGVYSGTGYFIYGVERVALATGRARFGNYDWFDVLAPHVVERALRPSDPVHTQVQNAAFFLLFISRGDTPVFFNKLDLTAAELSWNNRPNDIYFLANNLSELFESELNFQNVPVDWEIERWLGAPMTFVSVDEAFEFNETQTATLKQYLDLGGMLVVNPESSTRRVRQSVEALLEAMYPGAALTEADADHPVLSLWRPVRRAPDVFTYHNGARDLIVFFGDDVGFNWQRGGDEAYTLGANLYLHTTGYQRLEGRSATNYPSDPGARAQGPKQTVAVATADPNLEPGLWEFMRREFGRSPRSASRSQNNPRPAEVKPVANLTVVRQSLEDAGTPVDGGDPDLLHLVGIEAAELSEATVARIVQFADDGGTVLIETLGGQTAGRGDFASSLQNQFEAALGQPVERLSRYEVVFEQDPSKNTYDLGRVTYRPYSVRVHSTDNRPRLAAFRVNNRPAIFVSSEDLSLAAMGVRHWNLHGYSDVSARQILTNLLLNDW